MESAPTELLGLNPVTGKAPETRIRDGASARAIVQRLVRDDEPRSRQRALVKGLIDGNPPYNEAKRRASGLGWTANLNFMEGEALMESSGVPYYQLFNGVEHYAETKTAYQRDNPGHEQWHGLIAGPFHGLLKRWPQFDWNMQQASYQMRLHGKGPCFFDRDGDWRFRAIASGMLLAPKGTSSCVDTRVKFLAVRVTYSVVELWERIRDEKAASDLGWDVGAVRKAIQQAGNGMMTPGTDWSTASWEEFQKLLKNNDYHTSYFSEDIQCAHLLVQEFGGKISHFIVTESAVISTGMEPDKDEKFLFKHPNRYDGFEQALVVFFQNIGDGTWHSVRGYAERAFKHLEASNRLKGRMLDGAFIEASLVLQPGTTKNADKMQLMQVGPVTYIPAGAELRQTKLSGFLDGPMAVDRMLTNGLASNIGQSGSRSLAREDGRGEMPTATQINQQVAKEASLDQGQMVLWYLTADTLYKEVFRRAADPNTSDEEAKRFQRECREAGVPAKALQNMEYVRANRASGYGSPQMRQLTDQQMMPLVGMLPEDGKQNFLEDMVGGIKGADKVRRYVPRQHIPTQDDAIAALENAMVAGGRSPVIAAGQNDVIHLQSHLTDATETLAPLDEAMEAGAADPAALQEALQYVQVMAGHVQAHLDRLSADPSRKAMAQMFEEQLESIVAFHGKLRGAVIQTQRDAELAQDQAGQATALNALDAAKVQSVQTGMELKSAETQNKMRLAAMKQANTLRLQQIKTAENIRMQRAKEVAA